VQYRVLGPLQVVDGQPVPLGGYRQRLVLAVLLSRPNQVLGTDWLVDAVWGEEPPRTARKTLQVYLTRLRSLLDPTAIEAGTSGYLLRVEPDDLDALHFEILAAEGRRLLDSAPATAQGMLREALGLWRGLPFGDLADAPALAGARRRLLDERIGTLEDRIAADLAVGHGPAMVGELTDLVAEHPLRERLRAQLMLALYRADRQAEAIAVFDEGRRTLADELGLDPGQPLVALHERIVRQDPSLHAEPTVPDEPDWQTARNPYKGLRAFGPADAPDFFGRGALVDEIVARVAEGPLVVVTGASGSGKSSAVLAGAVPRLVEAHPSWALVTSSPGSRPLASLLAAIGDVVGGVVGARGDDLDLLRCVDRFDRAVVVVLDQLEQVFDPAVEPEQRRRFLRNLAEAVGHPSAGLHVVATLRADFLDRLLAEYPDGDTLPATLVPMVPPTPAELESAAADPARRVGVHLDPELTAELVADVARQPGALPLFEYALTEMFDHRTGPVLTRSAYRALGGLHGALARRAEAMYEALEPDAQDAARQVLLHLTVVHAGAAETGRRVARDDLETLGGSAATEVLDAFDRARLLTFDRDPRTGEATVQLAHEALLREWPRLRGWVDEARDDLHLHAALATQVADWEESGRDEDYLITGSRLARYDDWPAPAGVEPTEVERSYLGLARARRDEHRRARRRRTRRLRGLVAVASVLALVASTLAWVAVDSGRQAAASEREAHARELAGSASAVARVDPELAVLLALEAIEATEPDGVVLREAQSALHDAVSAGRRLTGTTGVAPAFVSADTLAVAGPDTGLVDASTGDRVLALPDSPSGFDTLSVATSADGSLLVTGSHGRDVVVWDAGTGEQVRRLTTPVAGGLASVVAAVALSPDSRLAAALMPWGEGLLVWDLATGDRVASSEDPRAWPPDTCCYPLHVAFSPDGGKVAATWYDHARIMDVSTGAWVTELRGHGSVVTDIAYSPDGSRLLTSSMDGTVRVWDAATGTTLASVPAPTGQLTSLALAPDGSRMLTGDDAGLVRLWKVTGDTARPVAEMGGLSTWVYNLAVSPDGRRGAGADGNTRMATWDITDTGRGEVTTWEAPGATAYSHDGTRLLTTDPATGDPVIVRTADWEPERSLTGGMTDLGDTSDLPFDTTSGRVYGAAWSPDDRLVAATVVGYTVVPDVVVVWDATSGEIVHRLVTGAGLRGSLAFSGDGRLLAAATCGDPDDGLVPTARVWDVATGDVVAEGPLGECGQSVGIDPSGSRLAVQTLAPGEPNVVVTSIETGEVLHTMTHAATWHGAATFSPDGSRLLTVGSTGIGRIWDAVSGDLLRSLQGHDGAVERAQWSADGSTIVTSGQDGTVRLWDAGTGEMGVVLSGHDGYPYVSLSPDGSRLATADGSVRIWTLDLDELAEIAQGRLTRPLTDAECVTYHVDPCE
jgi:WD40 repeat protein/DNA-binding SARP family transcriptional activator